MGHIVPNAYSTCLNRSGVSKSSRFKSTAIGPTTSNSTHFGVKQGVIDCDSHRKRDRTAINSRSTEDHDRTTREQGGVGRGSRERKLCKAVEN